MKEREYRRDREDYKGVSYICFPDISDMQGKNPQGKNKNTHRYEPYGNKEREGKSHVAISDQKKREYIPGAQMGKGQYITHKEYGYYRQAPSENTESKSPGPKRGVVEVRKYISPHEDGEKGYDRNGDE